MLCLIVMVGSAAWADIASGKWNNGFWWIDDEGTLNVQLNLISAKFNIPDYGEGKAPWYKYHDQIKAIHIGDRCMSIGRNAFYGLDMVEKVTGGERVESVAMFAFQNCGINSSHPIPQVYFPKCSYVGEFAFFNTNIIIVSLPLVEEWKANAVYYWSDLAKGKPTPTIYVDLGSEASELRPSAVKDSKYVFIQNPTPPDWSSRFSSSELYYSQFRIGHCTYAVVREKNKDCYPINFESKVIVPKEYLQTYINYYRDKKGAEQGYMCPDGRGKLCAGAPIYKNDEFLGCWYIDDGVLKVNFIDEIPGFVNKTAPWSSVLGTVEEMRLNVGSNTIPANAFKGGDALKGIKKLGFVGMYELTIGDNAFEGCNEMKAVVFAGANELTIGDSAFEGCVGLEEVTNQNENGLEKKGVIVGNASFRNCSSLKTFEIGLQKIGTSAFENCLRALKTIELKCYDIPDRAFYNCEALEDVDLSEIKSIGREAFVWTKIHEINLDKCASVGEMAFYNKTCNARSIKFGPFSGNAKFGSKCFSVGPGDIYVVDALSNDIPDDLFDESETLENITLHFPAEATIFYENHKQFSQMKFDKAFKNNVSGQIVVGGRDYGKWELTRLSGLLVIECDKNIPDFASPKEQPWYNYRDVVKDIDLDNCEQIGSYAFAGMENLKKFIVPLNCTAINDYAFQGCASLKNMNINKVTKLGNNVFEGCAALENIELGTKLESVGDYVFRNCPKLNYISNQNNTPATTTRLSFAEINDDGSGSTSMPTLDVPATCVTKYMADKNWSKLHIEYADDRGTWVKCGAFGDGMWILYDNGTLLISADKGPGNDYDANDPIKLGFQSAGPTNEEDVIYKAKRIEITGNISELNDCFNFFTNVESVQLCPSVKTLNSTFFDCEKLKEINLDNVETIGGSYAFSGTALTVAYLSNVKTLGDYSFDSCPELTAAVFGSACKVGKGVFRNCEKLTSVDLGGADLNDAKSCFTGCSSLENVDYKGRYLPYGIFMKCTALKTVNLSNNLERIDYSAFEGCTALKNLYCDRAMPPMLPKGTMQDVIGYEGGGDVAILGPEYDVWAFHHLTLSDIHLVVPPDFITVYKKAKIWQDMDIEGDEEVEESALPTGGSLLGGGKDMKPDEDDQNEENPAEGRMMVSATDDATGTSGDGADGSSRIVSSGSIWYLDTDGSLSIQDKGVIAPRRSSSPNDYWAYTFLEWLYFINSVEVSDNVISIPDRMFNCSGYNVGYNNTTEATAGITSVTLGEKLEKVGDYSLYFSGLKDVYNYADKIVEFGSAFDRETVIANDATLHVIKTPEDQYLTHYRSSNDTRFFPNIVADLEPRHPKVWEVSFPIRKLTIKVGESVQLEPVFTPANAENKTLRYVDRVLGNHVIVDENGLLTAVSEGIARIEAYSDDTFWGEPYMALWGTGDDVSVTLEVTVEPAGAEKEIFFTWKEGNGPQISYHVTDKANLRCEVAGPYDEEEDVLTPAVAKDVAGIVTIPEKAGGYTVTGVGYNACYERELMTELHLPATLTKIGKSAFESCYNLKNVYIPVSQPLQFTDAYGELMEESMGHNDAFYRVGEGDDGEGFATLHVPAGSRSAWNIYPWNEWFRTIIDDIVMPGDVNGDGIVNIVDVTMTIDHILGKSPEGFNAEAADVNGDKTVNIVDVTSIIDIILKAK